MAATALTEAPAKEQEEVKEDTKEVAQEAKGTAEEVKVNTKEEDIKGTRDLGAQEARVAGTRGQKFSLLVQVDKKASAQFLFMYLVHIVFFQ